MAAQSPTPRARVCITAGAVPEVIEDEIVEIMLAHYAAGASLRPGARELVKALDGRIALGVASNTYAALVHRALEASGLTALRLVVSGADMGRPKPLPDVYAEACRALGVAPADAIAFEDSPMGVSRRDGRPDGGRGTGPAGSGARPVGGRGAPRGGVAGGRGHHSRLTFGSGRYRTDVLGFLTRPPGGSRVANPAYAELHCHTNFSFLDGASAPDDLVDARGGAGPDGLAVTDHQGLYGAVRFASAAEAAGLHPVVGMEIELLEPAAADPDGSWSRPGGVAPGARRPAGPSRDCRGAVEGRPARPRPDAPGCPAIARSSRRTTGGSGRRSAGRTWCSWPGTRRAGGACAGWCRGRTWPGRRGARFTPGAAGREHAKGSWRCPVAATGSWRGACGPGTATGRGRSRSGMRGCFGAARAVAARIRRERVRHRALAPPAPRRRLAGRRGRASRRRSWDCRSW